RTAASADADAAAFDDGQPRVLSGDERAERLQRDRQSDQRHVLCATVQGDGDHRADEGVSGRRGVPPEDAFTDGHLKDRQRTYPFPAMRFPLSTYADAGMSCTPVASIHAL